MTAQILTISIPLTQENLAGLGSARIDTNDLKMAIRYGFFEFSQGSITFRRDETGKLRTIEREIVYREDDGKRVEKRIFYLDV